MQIVDINSPSAFGGRLSSPKFRAGLQDLDEYIGLEEDVDRFKALKLVKMAGKDAGFSAELVELLEYYVIRTDEADWKEGSQPINYQSVTTTAQDLDISERQVRNREKALHALGALSWQDSGNFKRYGMRDRETREIQYAFGVDLSPLASLMPVLEAKVAAKQAAKAKWNETKRKISAYRARIRALIAEAGHYDELDEMLLHITYEYEKISFSIRTYHAQSDLDDLLGEHKALYEAMYQALEGVAQAEDKSSFSCDTSATDETDFPHIQCTNFQTSNKLDYSNRSGISLQEGVAGSTETNNKHTACGDIAKEQEAESNKIAETISKITWKQVLNACSDRFKERIPLHERPLSWQDLTDAAHGLLPTLGIHKSAWWEACSTLGRTGATICIMIIDQKMQDSSNPIRSPGGYLREMTVRAQKGELNLQGSIFGLLKRSEESKDA
ncbi:MAG: hypothetical protein CMH27_03845 [Micavibrio sp.]|nr:hypothetical protein [Micavibrio sp.]|tara:strand:+ start:2472 stop:3797 length:1326 start_codon:yes stop_codon:yes gene_type:complete